MRYACVYPRRPPFDFAQDRPGQHITGYRRERQRNKPHRVHPLRLPAQPNRHLTHRPPPLATGQRLEPTTGGLYDCRARFYDPLVGSFISADTIVPEPAIRGGGIGMGMFMGIPCGTRIQVGIALHQYVEMNREDQLMSTIDMGIEP